MNVKHRIEGVDAFRDDLKRLAKDLDDGDVMRDAHYAIGQLVVDSAASRANALGRMEAKAAKSLRAGRAKNSASVTIGGASAPFALGAEFGSNRFSQFRPWRGSGKGAGYWLWPAVRAEDRAIERVYEQAIDKATARAFPD